MSSFDLTENIQFPIHFHSTCVLILYCFRYMVSYWLQIANFSYITCKPDVGVTHWNFTKLFGIRKQHLATLFVCRCFIDWRQYLRV